MALCPVTGSHFTECAGNHNSERCLSRQVSPFPRGFPFLVENEIVNRLPADYTKFWPIPRKV